MSERMTATEVRDRSIAAYCNQLRFRSIVDHVVHEVMEKSRIHERDETACRSRDVADLLTEVGAIVLQRVYEEDAELNRLIAERDHLLKLVTEWQTIRPREYLIKVADCPGEAP
jgi:hypothetical protein